MNPGADFEGYCDWKAWPAESFGVCPRATAAYFEAELARTPLPRHAPLRVVEIGFGNGGFAGWARSKGFDYIGSESIPELVARGEAAGFHVHDADWHRLFASVGAGTLDLVVALDVIEHLDLAEAEALLEAVRDALRPGGCVLARVPCGDSPFGRSAQYGDLTHRLTLSSGSVRQLAARHRFDVYDIRPPRMPLTGVGPRRAFRRLMVLGAQNVIARVINLSFHHSCPLVLTSNMVFVLTRPGASGPPAR